MARAKKLRNGLTPKQDTFTKVVLKQIADKGEANLTEAALQVYNTTSRKSASVIASNNLGIVSVREKIEQALSSQGLSLSIITNNLGNLANSKPEKVSGDTVLKANVELLKLYGAYPDKKSFQFSYSAKEKIENMSYKEAREELAKLDADLKELLEEDTPRDTQNSF